MKGTQILSNGVKIIKRYRKGRCYAAAFAPGTTDWQIIAAMAHGDAEFFPYNETTGEVLWSQSARPSHFRK